MAKRRRKKKPASFYETLSVASPLLLPETAFELPSSSVRKLPDIPWRAAAEDAAALAHDAYMYGARAWRKVITRRARLAYSVMAIAVVSVGVITATQVALATLQKYGSAVNNPAVIMNEKDVGTTITDRNGVVLFQGYGAVDRQSIPFNQMPTSIKQATLAAEDPSFYSDLGFSWRGTVRAAYQDLTHHNVTQGGSTITQQLIKNTLLNNEKSITRKYQEIVLSVDMDRHYSKDQILQMYLNTVYYGEGAYGIQSASETYFHKPAKDLTLQESATLAGLPQSPSLYDPAINPDGAQSRRDYVLDRMQQLGYAQPRAVIAAKSQPVVAGTQNSTIKAPHFVFYVLSLLKQQYGENEVEHGGITVRTTLDYGKQEQAQAIVSDRVAALASHHVTNGGLVSLDPRTGDIISMVGSVDYNQPGWGAVNTTLAQLQPGSSFKPIAYAEAFLKGWSGATVVQDQPMCWPIAGQAAYCPKDYDLKWRGPVLLRRALANSLNIPALQVLVHAGIPDTISLGHAMGIQSPSLDGDPGQYGLPLVLGAGDVRPIDMAAVYATFDEGGRSVVPRAILSVSDKFNKDITRPQPSGGKQVLDPRVAYMVTNILSDNQARQEEFGVHNPLQLSRPDAAKTGTTNDFNDNWTDGYTPNLVAVVWVGNNDHTPMQNVDGITGAAPIWHDYMEMASADLPTESFTAPSGVVTASICRQDGGLATPGDSSAVNEVFLAGSVPTKPCGSINGSATPHVAPAPTQPQPATPTPQTTAPSPTPPGGMGGGTTPDPNNPGSGGSNPGTPAPGGSPGKPSGKGST